MCSISSGSFVWSVHSAFHWSLNYLHPNYQFFWTQSFFTRQLWRNSVHLVSAWLNALDKFLVDRLWLVACRMRMIQRNCKWCWVTTEFHVWAFSDTGVEPVYCCLFMMMASLSCVIWQPFSWARLLTETCCRRMFMFTISWCCSHTVYNWT